MKAKDGFEVRTFGYGIGHRIVDPTDKKYPQINGLLELTDEGVFIWNEIQVEIEEEVLADKVAKKFDISKEQAAADVKALTDTLMARHLMEGERPMFGGPM